MTKLGMFIQEIAGNTRVKAALAASGLMAVLVVASSAHAGQTFTGQKAPVEDIQQARAINERVDDQLDDMRTFSAALSHSFSYGSPNISGLQKARNIAMAFEYSARRQSNPDLAPYDDYYLETLGDGAATEALEELVEAVNRKKDVLQEATHILDDIMQSYADGRDADAERATSDLRQLADRIEDSLYHDISFDGSGEVKPPTPSTL